jgi:hypothetical protein
MSRTISKVLKKRLQVQATEAKTLGLTKTAAQLDDLIKTTIDRNPDHFYSYSHEELQEDVETIVWEAALRVQDFYNKTGDAKQISEEVEVVAADLIDSIRHKIGGPIIGAYEPHVPGEIREHTSIEVSDDEPE